MIQQYITIGIVLIILLLVDLYIYQALKSSTIGMKPVLAKRILIGFWFITAMTFASVLMGIFVSIGRSLRTVIFVWFFVDYFSKLFIIPFLFIDDIRRGFIWMIRKRKPQEVISKKNTISDPITSNQNKISRSRFLTTAGTAVATVPFAALNIGMIDGVYDYEVRHVKINLPNLPKSFHGLKIAQVSDIHSGSFYNKKAVLGGIEMLLKEKADVIFFTGDLVNDRTPEVRDYTDIFSKVKAPLGVYSILGNHDYGDYVAWPSAEAKKKNLDDLKVVHKNLGWDLLCNENRFLEMGGEKVAILGVENWSSLGRFPKHGDIAKAYQGTEEASVKLLLSHDPSHWRAQIAGHYKDIDMMFSGHTHGMQFGIRTEYFQWSPVQYFYPEWAGLYTQEHQKLYVNVGYGFLGYPGRVGIMPEITIFELTNA